MRTEYNIHESFRFNGSHILLYGKGKINIGKDTYIGSFSTLQADQGCSLTIGESCLISHNVRIYTSSAVSDQDFSILPLMTKFGDVKIGNNVWIGANVFINPGVSIGDNSIIGANSVVVKNIEPFSINGGVPSKLIKYKSMKAE